MVSFYNIKKSISPAIKTKLLMKLQEKKSGAVYWLEIAACILLVILIILLIQGHTWTSWLDAIETNVKNMIDQVAGYWTAAK